MTDKRSLTERLRLCESTAAVKATPGEDIDIGPLCHEARVEIERWKEFGRNLLKSHARQLGEGFLGVDDMEFLAGRLSSESTKDTEPLPAICLCGHAKADHSEGLPSCSRCDCINFVSEKDTQ